MTLLEAARKYGVETHYYRANQLTVDCDTPPPAPRPDLEIAHDMLAKIKGEITLQWMMGDQWEWTFDDLVLQKYENGSGTFIEAVLALAERA